MTDINNIMLWIPINITYSLIFIIFLVILYFINIWLNNRKKQKVEEIIIKEPEKKEIDFNKILKLFEEKYIKSDKNIFYKKISEILKEIILHKQNTDISKSTLEEIKIALSLTLSQREKEQKVDLIKNIYFKEYAKEIEDSEEIRKELIWEVRRLI